MTSRDGFVWPENGYVEAPDWEPTRRFGNGLHGLEKGEQCSDHLNTSEESKWLVLRVDREKGFVDLGIECKFRCGEVIYCGNRYSAAEILKGVYPEAMVHYSGAKAKSFSAAITGDYGESEADDFGIAIAGYSGTTSAGGGGISIACLLYTSRCV